MVFFFSLYFKAFNTNSEASSTTLKNGAPAILATVMTSGPTTYTYENSSQRESKPGMLASVSKSLYKKNEKYGHRPKRSRFNVDASDETFCASCRRRNTKKGRWGGGRRGQEVKDGEDGRNGKGREGRYGGRPGGCGRPVYMFSNWSTRRFVLPLRISRRVLYLSRPCRTFSWWSMSLRVSLASSFIRESSLLRISS